MTSTSNRNEFKPLHATDEATREGAVGNEGRRKKATGKKIRPEITSLEQLIELAYRQKGRKVVLRPAQEKVISQDLKLSDESLEKLRKLAAADTAFAVPRQLLLLARSFYAGSGLRGRLKLFVRELLLSHPLLAAPDFDAAISNLDEAPAAPAVLAKILNSKRADLDPSPLAKLKDVKFFQLKTHVANCMALWIADMKSWDVGTLADAMFHGIWQVSTRRLPEDAARYRILTEVENPTPLGVACQTFVRLADEKTASAHASVQEIAALKSQIDSLKRQVTELRSEVEELATARLHERAESEDLLRKAHQSAADEATHLRDDFETLRTRVLRALKSDLGLLEGGLDALGRTPPKVAVMLDAAERVTDSMRREIRNAQGDR